MAKARINQKTSARCLLTEVAPYETPTLFSNWGSYNYVRVLHEGQHPPFLRKLFSSNGYSVPFKYRIKKDGLATRTLSLVHPNNSAKIVEFYRKYDIAMIRSCKRSFWSLRAPHHVAKFYTYSYGVANEDKAVEDITAETAYASSYFAYSRFSHLHKFFDSDDYTVLEKRFPQMRHLDITKFFPSLYTHSVAWAIRGKMRTKNQRFGKEKQNPKIAAESFDGAFDELLQQLNHRETHGIPIGPELCRIFSEVILQKVDSLVTAKLESNDIIFGKDYRCYRYIDDYFVFFSNPRVFEKFYNALSEELEKFKLYLNEVERDAVMRPFISPLSIKKIAISSYLKDLFDRRNDLRSHTAFAEVNRFRALIKNDEALFSGVSTFLLSLLLRQIRRVCRPADGEKGGTTFDVLYIYVDLAFHAFQMDIRVATSFKITAIILEVTKNLGILSLSERAKLIDKVMFEMRSAFESAILQGSSVECMNMLIANAIFSDRFPLPLSLLEECVETLRKKHDDEYSRNNKQRLSYFEMVSLIYYLRDHKEYSTLRKSILEEAKLVISELDPAEYAETAYLLLDLTACPLLEVAEKDDLISTAMQHQSRNVSPSEIAYFRNFVSRHSWYFNWRPADPTGVAVVANGMGDMPSPDCNLERHKSLQINLMKKQLLLAY